MSNKPDVIDLDVLTITYSTAPACANVQSLNYTKRCEYVISNAECSSSVFFFDYVNLLYCVFKPYNWLTMIVYMTLISSFVVVLLSTIAIVAAKVFCPAIQVLANVLGMSEYLAGITILAVANASSDLVTALASQRHGYQKITMFADTSAATLFVVGVVRAIICMLYPFRLPPHNIIRDLGFLILSSLTIQRYLLTDEGVSIWESLDYSDSAIADLEKEAVFGLYGRNRYSLTNDDLFNIINVHDNLAEFANFQMSPNINLFRQTWETINPFGEWNHLNKKGKVLLIIKSPISIAISLVIPIVNYQLKRHGWTKLLNCVQLVLMPIVVVLIVNLKLYTLVGVLAVTVPVAILLFGSTRTDLTPKYHYLLSIYSAVGSVFTIYCCMKETDQLVRMIGLISGCSLPFLGVTLFAWSSSLSDLVSNITMAHQGYPKMSYAACLGAPLVNSVLSIGISLFIRSYNSEELLFQVRPSDLFDNCFVFVLTMCSLLLFAKIIIDFNTGRVTAYFTITLYLIFLLYSTLIELEIMEPYNSAMSWE